MPKKEDFSFGLDLKTELNHVQYKFVSKLLTYLCLVLRHAYSQNKSMKQTMISYVQYFAYVYLMLHYVHVCTYSFKRTTHSNIHGMH